jgi:predicted short-subunit dehydrogenase-like oxidoreductase (DUF2520 family)
LNATWFDTCQINPGKQMKKKSPVSVKPRCAIVGYGRVGAVLAKALVERNYPLTGVVFRQIRRDAWLESLRVPRLEHIADLSPETDFIILCVRDYQIGELVDAIIERCGFKPGAVVAHTAGVLSAEILSGVRKVDALPLAWHPLQTFVGGEGSELLQGVAFGIDGDPAAVELGEKIAIDLGGVPYRIPPEKRPVYHLGAVVACDLMAGLIGMAMELLQDIGMDQDRALQALSPLVVKTAQNIAARGLPQAISGPFRRGDAQTILAHLEILKQHPDIEAVYRSLGRELLRRLDDENLRARLRSILAAERT